MFDWIVTDFVVGIAVIGGVLDATVINHQRRIELEAQFDYLELMPNVFGNWFSINEDQSRYMEEISHDDAGPVTDRIHHNSWSANLEKPQHADDYDLVLSQAINAVNHTATGHHVNLVTHANHGHPSEFLYQALTDEFGDDIDWEYIEQCGCGGHVTRVYVE